MNKTSNHFSCNEIETSIGKAIVSGNGVVENNVLKWTFILPVGTEINATISEEGGKISFMAPCNFNFIDNKVLDINTHLTNKCTGRKTAAPVI